MAPTTDWTRMLAMVDTLISWRMVSHISWRIFVEKTSWTNLVSEKLQWILPWSRADRKRPTNLRDERTLVFPLTLGIHPSIILECRIDNMGIIDSYKYNLAIDYIHCRIDMFSHMCKTWGNPSSSVTMLGGYTNLGFGAAQLRPGHELLPLQRRKPRTSPGNGRLELQVVRQGRCCCSAANDAADDGTGWWLVGVNG